MALVAEASPDEGLERLAANNVPTIVCGDERVDLRAALETLAAGYDVRTMRVDSGGALSGALVRAGLVHEVSVLLEPVLVGGVTARTFCAARTHLLPTTSRSCACWGSSSSTTAWSGSGTTSRTDAATRPQ